MVWKMMYCSQRYFCGVEQHQHVALYVCRKNVRTCACRKKISNVARRRQTSHDVARLLLMVPIEPWQNSTPVFGAAAFCTTKIDDFRASLTSPLRSLRWPRSKVGDAIIEVFQNRTELWCLDSCHLCLAVEQHRAIHPQCRPLQCPLLNSDMISLEPLPPHLARAQTQSL